MPTNEQGSVLDWPLVAVSRPIVAALFRLQVDGQIPPPGGPLLIAANHVSHLDPVILGVTVAASGRLPRFLTTDAVFELPVLGPLARCTGLIRVAPGGRALEAATAALHAGATVVIYPEGHVGSAHRQHRARLGIVALSRRTGTPILPVALWGMQRGDRRLAWARRRRAAVVIGEPLPPPPAANHHAAGEILDAVRALLPRARALAGDFPQSWG